MKDKKFVVICSVISCLLVLGIIYMSYSLSSKPKEINIANLENITNGPTIAYMVEQTAGAGDYVMLESADYGNVNSYILNEDLSKCENGGVLSYGPRGISLKADKSDKCYIYLDKKITLKVNNVTVSKTGYSITVHATGETQGSNNTYQFSNDGGSTWQNVTNQSTSASYTFSGLNGNTTYYISVKITDGSGKTSAVYNYGNVTTDSYTKPVVNGVTYGDYDDISIDVTVGSAPISYMIVCFWGLAGTEYRTLCTTQDYRETVYPVDDWGMYDVYIEKVTVYDENGVASNTWNAS